MTEGLIILDKPSGMSSARAVNAVKRMLPRRTKIGHAGTLDPFATGVLVILIGRATRRSEKIMSWRKEYETTMRLGATTATDDRDSPPQSHPGASSSSPPSEQMIREALPRFVGQIQQRPPRFSALWVQGERAYARARAGDDVELQPRPVHVYSIELLEYAWPLLRLRIECGRGTYIRALARDLGEALGVGGYVEELRRTRVGDLRMEKAVALEGLTPERVQAAIVAVPG